MNPFIGKIIEIADDSPSRSGKVQVGGAITRISLQFLPEARVGDQVFVESGVALSIVQEVPPAPQGEGPSGVGESSRKT
jgi:hydrogenase maturation factor